MDPGWLFDPGLLAVSGMQPIGEDADDNDKG